MDKGKQQQHAAGKPAKTAPRPLEEAELDAVAGGKRSQVKNANDRYANTEVSY